MTSNGTSISSTTLPMNGGAEVVDYEVPCTKCHDSGYVETSSGGHWTGENIVTTQTLCDCACGDDARDQENGTGLHAAPALVRDGIATGSTLMTNLTIAEMTISELVMVLHQYVSDLRYPPQGDSVQRRIEAAEAVLAKAAAQ
jgi:hypothetical protein